MCKILVIGDFMVDHYIWGNSDRISPEAPVPVVDVLNEEDRLGGAGNVVNNLLNLGCDVLISTVIGEHSNRLLKLLSNINIDTSSVYISNKRKTTIKSRVFASGQQLLRFDKETNIPISSIYENKILNYLQKTISIIDLILISDYGKGVMTETLTQKIIKISNNYGKKVIIDPKEKFSKYKNTWMLKPNEKELSLASGIDIKNDYDLKKAGFKLKSELNLNYLLVTLGEKGMALFSKEFIKIPTLAREVYDVTGAGDTVLASLGYSLSNNDADLIGAIHFANQAAAIVIGKTGSAVVTIDEIIKFQKDNNPSSI